MTTITPTHPQHEGDRLRYVRELRGLSLSDVAKLAKVGRKSAWRHEQSGAIPLIALRKYVRALHVSEQWLRYGIGPGPDAEPPTAIVEKYLKSPMGKTCDPTIAALLLHVPYASLAVYRPTLASIHRVRELIEMNRLLEANTRQR